MLARKAEFNYYPQEIYEYPSESKVKKESKEKRNKKAKPRIALKAIFVLSGLIIMTISLFILFRYANITKMRMDVTQLERQIVELEKNRLELTAELDGIKSSPEIIAAAKNKLGMSFPKEGQVAYISVIENGDNSTQRAENKDSKVAKLISSLF